LEHFESEAKTSENKRRWRTARGLETQLESAGCQQRIPQAGKIGAGKSPVGTEVRVRPGERTGASLPRRLNRVRAEPIAANEAGRHLESRRGRRKLPAKIQNGAGQNVSGGKHLLDQRREEISREQWQNENKNMDLDQSD
jgi:hypothetical protein